MACKQGALLIATYVLILRRRKLGRKLKVITRSLVKPIFNEERKQRAEWEKLVKEVNNADREFSHGYLWMSLERFDDLFSFASPDTKFFLGCIWSKYEKMQSRNNTVFGHFSLFTQCCSSHNETQNVDSFDWKL